MEHSKQDEILKIMEARKLSAILRTDDAERAGRAMRAAVEGGFRVVEFTLNTPGALEHIAAFARDTDLLVGAGTVLTPEDAERAVAAGARFIVSPVMDPEVIRTANRLGAVSVPGTSTPTEMLAAHRAGAHVVKLFPAPSDLPATVKQVLGPLPFLRVFPTAGVTPENFRAVLAAGAFGVGFVNSLFVPSDLAAGNYDAVRERARAIHAALAG